MDNQDTIHDDHCPISRRQNKPMIEKRRRARINGCLEELKTIVLEAREKQSPQNPRLEKADILEMTVDYLKALQTEINSSQTSHERNNLSAYEHGYNACLLDVVSAIQSSNQTTALSNVDDLAKLLSSFEPSNNRIKYVGVSTSTLEQSLNSEVNYQCKVKQLTLVAAKPPVARNNNVLELMTSSASPKGRINQGSCTSSPEIYAQQHELFETEECYVSSNGTCPRTSLDRKAGVRLKASVDSVKNQARLLCAVTPFQNTGNQLNERSTSVGYHQNYNNEASRNNEVDSKCLPITDYNNIYITDNVDHCSATTPHNRFGNNEMASPVAEQKTSGLESGIKVSDLPPKVETHEVYLNGLEYHNSNVWRPW